MRSSTEGTNNEKKKIVEIPTPVFQAENRRNHSFLRSSESLVKLETTQTDNSPAVFLNTEKVDKELKALKATPQPVIHVKEGKLNNNKREESKRP